MSTNWSRIGSRANNLGRSGVSGTLSPPFLSYTRREKTRGIFLRASLRFWVEKRPIYFRFKRLFMRGQQVIPCKTDRILRPESRAAQH